MQNISIHHSGIYTYGEKQEAINGYSKHQIQGGGYLWEGGEGM